VARVWLSIGSNIDRAVHIAGALRDLRAAFGPLIVSRVYASEAVGFKGDAFYNLVVGVESPLAPRDLNRVIRGIEDAHGRLRGGEKFSSRTLDIDLLTYDQQVIRAEGLVLPRDEILKYAFVLRPLAELAPGERHPLVRRSYAELWAAFAQASQPLEPVDFPP